MAQYREEDYSLDNALKNINANFFRMFKEELRLLAVAPERVDVAEQIHREWNQKYHCTPNGTSIRIEWAIAIHKHGDWDKALSAVESGQQRNTLVVSDPRKKYPADFRCENGVYVRSLSELFIADWLYMNKIRFEYEREVSFPSCQQTALCDFYLPDYKVYIEFWGMENDEQYLAYRKWKENLYRNHEYLLLSLEFCDLKMFRDIFTRKLNQIRGKR